MEPDRWLGVELRHLAAPAGGGRGGQLRPCRDPARLHAVGGQPADRDAGAAGRSAAGGAAGRPAPGLDHRGRNVLLRHADGIVARLRAAQADLAALQDGSAGSLRVGTYQSVGARVLPEVMLRFSTAHPHVDVAALRERGRGAAAPGRGRRSRPHVHPAAAPRRAVRGDRAAARSARAGGAEDSPLAAGPVPSLREVGEEPLIGYRTCTSGNQLESQLRLRGSVARDRLPLG